MVALPKFVGKTEVEREIDDLATEFRELRSAESDRLDRFEKYRDELDIARERSIDRARGQREHLRRGRGADYGRTKRGSREEELERHAISLGLGRAATVKHAHRIAGRLPDCSVEERAETPEERFRSDTMEKIVWAIHRASHGDEEFSSAAWDGSELGAACFEVYFEMDRQMPLYRAIDPATVIVVKGVHDPHDFQRVYRFWSAPTSSVIAEYRNQKFRGEPVKVDDIESGREERDHTKFTTIVQMSDKEKTIRFALEGAVPLYELKHNYGFAPYVVIPNLGPPRAVWGWADYEQARALGAYIEANVEREADILRAVANGAMVLKGRAKVTPEQAAQVMRNGGVLPVGEDGGLEPVPAPEVPQFAQNHSERVLRIFKMATFTPDASWGEGGAASGSDRGLQLGPQLEYTALKQINWGGGLSRLFAMCFKMLERKQAGRARFTGTKRKGAKRENFNFELGPDVEPLQINNPDFIGEEPEDIAGVDLAAGLPEDAIINLPRSPKELFDGDYTVTFVWNNRVDPDDPAFVASEVSKFVQGVQSLRTTLERLGIQNPEDEMLLIEQESDRFPWLRNGMIQLIRAQLQAEGQGEGGGAPQDIGGGFDDVGAEMMDQGTVANDADLMGGALPGEGSAGALY